MYGGSGDAVGGVCLYRSSGGGERDELPPVFVRSNPEPGALEFKGNRLNIFFDENIKMEDVMNKVVVSPPQKNIPSITANGKRVTAELRDSMLDNTTLYHRLFPTR